MVVIVDRRKAKTPEEEAQLLAASLVEEQYQNYDVVWARVPAYPWWPSVLFYSWEAVSEANLDLKAIQSSLFIPPPRVQPTDDGKGEQIIHSALIMFLDKFDCVVVEITPKTVCSFDLNFEWCKDAKGIKPKDRTPFRIALERAQRIYHMEEHMKMADLDAAISAFAIPAHLPDLAIVEERHAPPKKQKRGKAVAIDEIDDDDDDAVFEMTDDEEDSASEYSEGEDPPPKQAKSKSKARGNSARAKKEPTRVLDLVANGKPVRQRGKAPVRYIEAIEDDESDDFEIQVSRPRAKAASKPVVVAGRDRKASRKEVRNDSEDIELVATQPRLKAAPKPVAAGKNRKASRKEGRTHQQDVIDVDSSESEVEIQVQQVVKRPKKADAKGKAPNGKVKAERHDDDSDFEVAAAKKPKKPSGGSKPKQPKRPKGKPSDSESDFEEIRAAPRKSTKPKASNKQNPVEIKDEADTPTKDEVSSAGDQQAEGSMLTPLSSIWTTQEEAKTKEQPARLAYKLDLLWDDAIFTDHDTSDNEATKADPTEVEATNGRGKRQGRSVQQSQIRQSLLTGNLDPHTMVQCESYLPKGAPAVPAIDRPRGVAQLEAPYEVVVHPDAVFVCDLHSHLATCEIIGFLGGRWDETTKTLHIQAAFPCRSLVIDGDDGSTDVEMDPGSEIELREIIQNAQLEVVGWYHSHPAFAPDPSVRDIENQTSYQQLFQRRKQVAGSIECEVHEPFVGLIVGTYDPRRESPVGLFRYFHCRGEKVTYTREVYMPYELVPRTRRYRSVVEEERTLPKEERVLAVKTESVKQVKVDESVNGVDSVDAKPEKVDGRRRKRKVSDVSVAPTAPAPVDASVDLTAASPAKKKPRGKTASPKRRGKAKSAVAVEVIELTSDLSQEVITVDGSDNPKAPEIVDLQSDDPTDVPASKTTRIKAQMPPVRDALPADEVVIIDSSSQTQSEVVSIDSSSQTQSDAPEEKESTASARAEEIVCDSSQSQGNVSDIEIARGDGDGDDYVPASSSSSQGDGSSGYEASQSQSILETLSQAVVSDLPPYDDLDPFAGVEVLPSLDASPVLQPKTAVAATAVELFDVQDSVEWTESDEVIGDSAPDSSACEVPMPDVLATDDGSPANAKDPRERDGETTRTQRREEDDSGAVETLGEGESASATALVPDAEAAATAESAALLQANGGGGVRRRMRKASAPMRSMDSRSSNGSLPPPSPGPTSSSPHSPGPFFPMGEAVLSKQSSSSASAGKASEKPVNLKTGETKTEWGDLVVIGESDGTDGEQPKQVAVDVEALGVDTDVTMTDVEVEEKSGGAEAVAETTIDTDVTMAEVDESDGAAQAPTQGEPMGAEQVAEPKTIELIAEANTLDQAADAKTVELVDEPKTLEQAANAKTVKQGAETKTSQLVAETKTLETVGVAKTLEQVAELKIVEQVAEAKTVKLIAEAKALEQVPETKEAVPDAPLLAVELAEETTEHVNEQAVNKRETRKRSGKKERKAPRGEDEKQELLVQYLATADGQTSPLAMLEIPLHKNSVGVLRTALSQLRYNVEKVSKKDCMGTVYQFAEMMMQPVPQAQSDNVPTAQNSEAADTAVQDTQREDAGVVVASVIERVLLAVEANVGTATVPPVPAAETSPAPTSLEQRRAAHLESLRTKYGPGVYGCTEQVVTLIDYYRAFERRTDLFDIWKSKITRCDKLDASLRANVRHLQLPVALRDAFVDDIMHYLLASWKL